MTFIDLCAGIGGFSLGLERAGLTCIGQVEYDNFCNRILARHWPDVPRWGDITTLDPACLPAAELLVGGYPCQPFSLAGKRGNVPINKMEENMDIDTLLAPADMQARIESAIDAALERVLAPVARLETLRRKETLTTEEVSELFGLNAESLVSQRARRKGPPYTKVGARVLYRPQAVRDYLDARRVRTID